MEKAALNKRKTLFASKLDLNLRKKLVNISCTDHVRSEEVLHRVKKGEEYSAYNKKKKANWIGHILRRNCLLKRYIEGKKKEKKKKT